MGAQISARVGQAAGQCPVAGHGAADLDRADAERTLGGPVQRQTQTTVSLDQTARARPGGIARQASGVDFEVPVLEGSVQLQSRCCAQQTIQLRQAGLQSLTPGIKGQPPRCVWPTGDGCERAAERSDSARLQARQIGDRRTAAETEGTPQIAPACACNLEGLTFRLDALQQDRAVGRAGGLDLNLRRCSQQGPHHPRSRPAGGAQVCVHRVATVSGLNVQRTGDPVSAIADQVRGVQGPVAVQFPDRSVAGEHARPSGRLGDRAVQDTAERRRRDLNPDPFGRAAVGEFDGSASAGVDIVG